MATFGKILAVFNVLAAILFLIIAGKDYGTQQSWAYTEFRHRLAITGLPVDKDDIDENEPDKDYPVAERMTPGVVKQVFEGYDGDTNDLGGPGVKTLFEEVDRVKAKARDNVTKAQPKDQPLLLKKYLLGLAKTLGERMSFQAAVDGPDGITKGLDLLSQQFDESKKSATLGAANKTELRARIAHVLVNVNDTEPWRKRVMAVVGMEAYIDALNRQADSFAFMFNDMQQLIASDQAAFERLHSELVEVIQKDSDDLYKANVFLADLQKTANERQQQVATRTTEKNNYDARLTQARDEASNDVAKLNAIQKDLFVLQEKLGLAMKRNQDLETELEKLERNSKR